MNEDKIIQKLLDHDERLERIEEKLNDVSTKEDINKISSTLDEILGYVKKNDQEITFMGQRVKRNEEDIRVIKPLVGLSVEA